jgi:tetratricopeptide (TPR) repeat protein
MLRHRTSIGLFHFPVVAFIIGFASLSFKPAQASSQTGFDLQSPQTAADYVKAGRDFSIKEQTEQAIQAYRWAIELDPKSEEAYLELSPLLSASGKVDELVDLLYSGHQQIPSSKPIAANLFMALMRSGRDDDIVEIGREYIAQEPQNVQAMAAVALIYSKRKQFLDAAELWERVIDVDAKNAAAWYGLAGAYVFLNRTQEAMDAFQHVLDIVPNGELHNLAWAAKVASLAKLGLTRESIELVEREVRLNPDNDLAFLLRAVLKQGQNLPEEAIADAEQVVALSGNPAIRSIAYSVIGGNQIMMSRYQDAISPLKKSIELFPENAPSHALLAAAYFYLASYDDAIDELDLAIHSKLLDLPVLDNAKFTMEAFNNLALCLVKIGRLEDAEKALRYSAQLDPTQSGPRTNLAIVLLSQKKYSDAESELRACIRLGIADWRTYTVLGSVLVTQKRYPDCIPIYRQALRLQPENPMILNDLGYALAETNTNLEEAIDLLKRAVKLVPLNGAVHDSLGWAYFKSGDLAKAEEVILHAVKLDPKSFAISEHLGDVYQRMGRKADANIYWKSALTLATDDESKVQLQSKIDKASGI